MAIYRDTNNDRPPDNTYGTSEGGRPHIAPDTREGLTFYERAQIDKDRVAEIKRWFEVAIPDACRATEDDADRRKKFRDTLSGKRAKRNIRMDASNLSVPLTVWAEAAMRARLRLGTTETDQIASVRALVARTPSGANTNEIAKSLASFIHADFNNPRGLGGKIAVDKCIKDLVPMGTGAIKVFVESPLPRKVYDIGGALITEKQAGRARMEYIAEEDVIAVDGYGTDTQAMPFVGHKFPMTWGDMQMLVALGTFDGAAVNKVEQFYKDRNSETPARFRVHNLAEIYLDYCTEKSDTNVIPTALCVTWHLEAKEILRVTVNPMPHGIRPIYIANFDSNPDPTKWRGLGVCHKLEGAQDETDEIHNLGIEAAKRAVAHVILLKEGRGVTEDFGSGEGILPGDIGVTENPAEDMVAVPLGAPQGNDVALLQEANSRQYVMRILGLDEASLGNVESGKRVPASLGLGIQREGRVIVNHALASLSTMLTDANYLVLELHQRYLPLADMVGAIGEEAAVALQDAVFSPIAGTIRDKFLITINAIDAAIEQESRKQEIVVLNQMLSVYYDKYIQYASMLVQIPPPMAAALLSILQKMENGMRVMLAQIDSIQNADEVLPSVAELQAALQEMQTAMAGAAPAAGMGGGGGGAAAPPATTTY